MRAFKSYVHPNNVPKQNEKKNLAFQSESTVKTSDFAPVSSKEFLDIQAQATIECGFTLKRAQGMIKHTVKCTIQVSIHNRAQSFGQFG